MRSSRAVSPRPLDGAPAGPLKLLVRALSLALVAVAACADVPADPLADGSPCELGAQCASGLCLAADDGWPDGLCASACGDGCGAGLACASLAAGALCLPACDAAADCRPGWVCAPEAGVCLPDCRGGFSCGGLVCDDATGLCGLTGGEGAPDGAPCAADGDCASGACVGGGAPGSLCAGPCDGAACGPDERCVRLGTHPLCLPACGEGCGADRVCAPGVDACLPDCRAGWSCGSLACLDDGTCGLPESPGAPVGAPCQADLDCAGSVCLAADGQPGACAAPCAAGECPAGQVCARLGDHLMCVAACASTCAPGHVCAPDLGACLPDCRDGWDCGALTCDAGTGVCGLPDATGGAVGAACGGPAECESGACAAEADGWKGGMCVAACVDGACPTGQSCVTLGGTPLCLPVCAGGCRDGYVCSPAAHACLPDCRLGWSCGDGLVCQDDGRCGLPTTTPAPLGAPCAADADCASAVCFRELDGAGQPTGWKDGTCAAPCGSAACGDGGCVVLDQVSWCLPPCTAGSCRQGYVCSSDLHVCLPDCRLGWSCGGSFTCGDDGECRIVLPTLAPLAAPCQSHAECESGACMLPPQLDVPWSYGVCIQPCGAGCPAGTACTVAGPSQLCMPPCAPGCPTGYVCPPQQAGCVPSCTAGWPCPPGATCNAQGLCGGAGPGPGGP